MDTNYDYVVRNPNSAAKKITGLERELEGLRAEREEHQHWVTELAALAGQTPTGMVNKLANTLKENKRLKRLLQRATDYGTSNAWWQDVKAALEADNE